MKKTALIALALVLTGCSPLQLVGPLVWLVNPGAGKNFPRPRPTCPAGVDPQAVTWCRVAAGADKGPAEE